MNDQFNLNKFISQKQKLRKLNQTEGIDEESIVEQIGESLVSDVQTESYIRSAILGSQSQQATALLNNFVAPTAKDTDPLSIINIFAKRHAAPEPQPRAATQVGGRTRKTSSSPGRPSPTKASKIGARA